MKIVLLILLNFIGFIAISQSIPAKGENIDFLVTSGSDAQISIGDDDHQQVIYFLIPETVESAFYIRVFDPEINGKNDEINGVTNTKTTFKVYGGNGAHSALNAKSINYVENISGSVLFERTFGSEKTYDNEWFSFGPLNPKEGELDPTFKGYIFKVVVNGLAGDDVNLYRCAVSSSNTANLDIPGANAFTYEYSVRLKSEKGEIAHFYPYIDEQVVSIKQFNFDFDYDGKMRLFSSVKKGEVLSASGNGTWSNSKHYVDEKEKGKCLDLQVIKNGSWHNDMVIYIVNQYNVPVPFFAVPLGGVPEPEMKFKTIKQGE